MKNLGSKLLWIAVILWLIWGVINTFGGLDNVELIGNGSMLIGFLKLPFCLFGGIQLIRGVLCVIAKDTEKFDNSGSVNYTLCVLYVVSTIAGIMFFIDAYYAIN